MHQLDATTALTVLLKQSYPPGSNAEQRKCT